MNLPEKDEFVVCTVEKILDYGVEVRLEEYPGQKGFVPLGQVAARWVKNIRNFVKNNQIRVAKVIYINFEKNQVNLSFAMVPKPKEEQRLSEWRQTKRVQQLLTLVAKELKLDLDKIWDKITEPILLKYNSVLEGFQDLKRYGKDYFEDIPKEYRTVLYNIVEKNITINDKSIIEIVKIETQKEDGLNLIKTGFKNLPTDKDITSIVKYQGNGKYMIKAEAKDYKLIEKYLTNLNDHLQKHFSKIGTIEIKREK